MKQYPHYLHAILVHQGDADIGHYYAFIYDRKTCKWYRFNDYKVLEVSEASVLEESFGGNSQKTSAYGLIYVNQEIEKSLY